MRVVGDAARSAPTMVPEIGQGLCEPHRAHRCVRCCMVTVPRRRLVSSYASRRARALRGKQAHGEQLGSPSSQAWQAPGGQTGR
jgi:hypothetical protein